MSVTYFDELPTLHRQRLAADIERIASELKRRADVLSAHPSYLNDNEAPVYRWATAHLYNVAQKLAGNAHQEATQEPAYTNNQPDYRLFAEFKNSRCVVHLRGVDLTLLPGIKPLDGGSGIYEERFAKFMHDLADVINEHMDLTRYIKS